MPTVRTVLLFGSWLIASSAVAETVISDTEAAQHVGQAVSVEGTITRVYRDCERIFEQPIVHCQRNGGWSVTISHADSLAVGLAYPGGHPMGFDIERIDTTRHAHSFNSRNGN
jgi:hypothetical protein